MAQISIIVPVYRAEAELPRCVDSILAQTFRDFELILVDDGSPDGSGDICDRYARMDNRICVLHKENGGVSSARNAGLEKATGNYVLFVDSDDYLDEDYCLSIFQTGSDLVICGICAEDERGKPIFTFSYVPVHFEGKENIDYLRLYKENMVYGVYAKLFRMDLIRSNLLRFPEGISWGEDGMFVADYLRYTDSVRILDCDGYHYVRYDRANSLSTKIREEIADLVIESREYCLQTVGELVSDAQKEYLLQIITQDICENCAYFVSGLFSTGAMNSRQKREVLSRFLRNPYVLEAISRGERYFCYDKGLQCALRLKTPAAMLFAYKVFTVVGPAAGRPTRWVPRKLKTKIKECIGRRLL